MNFHYTDVVFDLDKPDDVRVLGVPESMGGTPGELVIPQGGVRNDVLSLIEKVREEHNLKSGSRIKIDDKWFRLTKIKTEITEYIKLRRISSYVPTLNELHVLPVFIEFLQAMALEPGLHFITGPMRSSKTTFASALLREWLDTFGGIAITIEEPPEYPLEGTYKGHAGLCMQIPVHDDDWETPFKEAMRSSSKFLLVGEIRSGRAASLAIKAASKGAAVIATGHAHTAQEGITSLVGYCKDGGGSPADVAAVLKGVFRTSMQAYRESEWRTAVRPLFMSDHFLSKMYASSPTKVSTEKNALSNAIKTGNHKAIDEQLHYQDNYLRMLAQRMQAGQTLTQQAQRTGH